jgi:hypothetical protein
MWGRNIAMKWWSFWRLWKNEAMKHLPLLKNLSEEAFYVSLPRFITSPQQHWFRTFLIPNLSDSEQICSKFWTYLIRIPNLYDSDPNLSDSDSEPIWFWTHLILNLSDTEPKPDPPVLPQCPPLPSILRWLVAELGAKQVNHSPAGNDPQPRLLVCPVVKLGNRQVIPSLPPQRTERSTPVHPSPSRIQKYFWHCQNKSSLHCSLTLIFFSIKR